MPEGDILRRTARTLDEALRGERLVAAELRWPSVAGVHLAGRVVLGTHAYGKHLFTDLDDERTVHSHLRMEGSWRVARAGSSELARATADPGTRALLVAEPWAAAGHRLGMLDVVPTRRAGELISHLGPDVLGETFPAAGLPEALRRLADQPGTPVAEALLDQRVVAGIGTIYAAESLYARRVWPWTPVGELTDPGTLLMTARGLMQRSVAAPGPTATGEVRHGRGTHVHGRDGQPCRRCGGPVHVGTARRPPQERPIFYCPVCQPRA